MFSSRRSARGLAFLGVTLATVACLPQVASSSQPTDAPGTSRSRSESRSPTLASANSPFTLTQQAPSTQKAPPEAPRANEPKREAGRAHGDGAFHYREISSFFNIREAYSNVAQGEWEFETEFGWKTVSESPDAYGPSFSLKYGVTNTFHVELEVDQIVLGQGGDQGNGELALILFNQWWKESEGGALPAFATWGEMRIPSGEGSSGVDGELHFNLTKTLLPKFRGHLEGFVETANGARGGEDADSRRAFQWGVGPGLDYSFSDDTIAAVNYLMRSSEEDEHHNQNILQFGLAQRVAQHQHLKLAVDVGLDGADETPNLGAKILWSIEW